MRILLVNDDGFDSEGLQTLFKRLNLLDKHELWIVAPNGERSGMSHYITLKEPIKSVYRRERCFEISGSPADCVRTAVLGIMPERPDLVLSGINHGPNLGTDITYSGTVAGAREAAYMGIAGVALSINAFSAPWSFEPLADFVGLNLELFAKLSDKQHFLNINAPNETSIYAGVEITHPCLRNYNDQLTRYTGPLGHDYWFVKGAPIDTSAEEGSDWNAVSRGQISLSPIHLHPMNNRVDEVYGKASFVLNPVQLPNQG